MLSQAQIAARKGKLTASRIGCLMQGDARKIMALYEEMTDQGEPENLDHVWPVQLGIATEQLSLDWYEYKSGRPVTRRGEVVVHPVHSWAACTLDGFDAELPCCVEAKHVGGREPLEVIVGRYWPQCHWLMHCTGTRQCALSVIMGANEPIVEYLERDDDYLADMIARGRQFMSHVQNRTPPVALDALAPVLAVREVDMEGNNRWASNAAEWLETKGAADRNDSAAKVLKSLVPDDAKICTGHGVRVSRDRVGRLSLRRV